MPEQMGVDNQCSNVFFELREPSKGLYAAVCDGYILDGGAKFPFQQLAGINNIGWEAAPGVGAHTVDSFIGLLGGGVGAVLGLLIVLMVFLLIMSFVTGKSDMAVTAIVSLGVLFAVRYFMSKAREKVVTAAMRKKYFAILEFQNGNSRHILEGFSQQQIQKFVEIFYQHFTF